jgi:predicted nucleic acid-binding protein
MNLVDSSLWLEYLDASPNGEKIKPIIQDTAQLLVPTIAVYEVFRKLLAERDENAAWQAAVVMRQGNLVPLTEQLSYFAAQTSKQFKLAMADSIIYATTLTHQATLWTQDRHFEGLEQVEYWEK